MRRFVRRETPSARQSRSLRSSVATSLLAHLAHNRRARTEVRLFELGKGYLSASEDFRQPLCGNEEGWGRLFGRLGDFFDRRFGPDWRKSESQFWKGFSDQVEGRFDRVVIK